MGILKRYDLLFCCGMAVLAIVWQAAFEIEYDGGPMAALPSYGLMVAQLLPLFVVYFVRELMSGRRFRNVVATACACATFVISETCHLLVLHYKPDCDRCHMPLADDFLVLVPAFVVFAGLIVVCDVVAERILRAWDCAFTRHCLARLLLRFAMMFALSYAALSILDVLR